MLQLLSSKTTTAKSRVGCVLGNPKRGGEGGHYNSVNLKTAFVLYGDYSIGDWIGMENVWGVVLMGSDVM